MKTKTLMLVCALLSGLVTGSLRAKTETPFGHVQEAKIISASSQNDINTSFSTVTRSSKRNSILRRSSLQEEEVQVTLKYDKLNYFPQILTFFSNSNEEYPIDVYVPEGEDSFSVMVPEGEYWVHVAFITEKPLPFIHIIKENVEIDSNTELTFDAEEATNTITFKTITPDGEEAIQDLIDFNDIDNIMERGTVSGGLGSGDMQTSLYEKNFGEFFYFRDFVTRYYNDGTIIDDSKRFDIRINSVSSRFTCTHSSVYATHEGNPILTNMGSFLDKSCTVINNAKDYQFIKNKFSDSDNNIPDLNFPKYEILFIGNSESSTFQNGLCSEQFTSPDYYVGLSNLQQYSNYDCYSVIKKVELADFNDYFDIVKGICSAPYSNINDRYRIFNYSTGYFNVPSFYLNTSLCSTNPNPVYSFYKDQFDPIYGNSVPWVTFIPYITYSYSFPEYSSPGFGFGFIGINGELRESDLYAAKLNVKFNGHTVCESINDLGSWCYDWFAEGAHRGIYDITVIDKNMKVDDMQGQNVTSIHFDTTNDSDCLPPLLTWMQYRDGSDHVTSSIKDKDGGHLLFSAGDFEYIIFNDDNRGYACREEQPEVKVEYAPHGSEEFSELMVTERPEDFFMPGFGFQYEVALDQVTRKAPGGWFDIRISLADAAGNRQSQVMSPAFRLKDQAGVGSIHDYLEGVRIEGHDIIAPAGAVILSTDGLRTDGKDVTPGIYIVRCGERAVKLRVR